ncbi:MAG: hypothetical protein IT258_21130 [Saprospiraceae bacterium]|nr:hypothetical protein [Saprospiraceae bacterium]
MYLARNIQVIRDWLRETQTEFGARFDIGKAAIWKWETGNSEPNVKALMLLEDLSGLPMNRIVRDVLTVEMLDANAGVLRDPEQKAVYAKSVAAPMPDNALSDLMSELVNLRKSLEAEREAAENERAENAKFRKELDFLKKKVEMVDAELLRLAGKKKG